MCHDRAVYNSLGRQPPVRSMQDIAKIHARPLVNQEVWRTGFKSISHGGKAVVVGISSSKRLAMHGFTDRSLRNADDQAAVPSQSCGRLPPRRPFTSRVLHLPQITNRSPSLRWCVWR